jgi:hypothetical protein
LSVPRNEPVQIDRSARAPGEERQSKRSLATRAKDQLRNFVLMFFYLWVVFGLFVVHESIVLSQHQINYQFHGLAVVNALIFAKVMLAAEDLRLGHRLHDQPLICTILFKSLLFAVVLIAFHMVEHVLVGVWNGRPVARSIADVGADKLGRIVSLGLVTTVALIPFFILREISRVIGPDNFWSLFFQRRKS